MTWESSKSAGLSSAERGYGAEHRKARTKAAKRHRPSDPCQRCGHALGPMGSHLHYDHHDDRTQGYLGFSHGSTPCPVCGQRCNEVAGSRAGARAKNAKAQRLAKLRGSGLCAGCGEPLTREQRAAGRVCCSRACGDRLRRVRAAEQAVAPQPSRKTLRWS